MKKKFILLPITLTSLTPTISLVGCGDPDTPIPPEPEYIDIYLSNSGENTHYSDKITLEKGKSYKFVIEDISSSEDNFVFTGDDLSKDIYINAKLNKIIVNGSLSTDYVWIFTGTWSVQSWHHKSGEAEVYITVNETAKDVHALTAG